MDLSGDRHMVRSLGWDCVTANTCFVGKGDVIGCGLNFMTKELFWTKNGELVGMISCSQASGSN